MGQIRPAGQLLLIQAGPFAQDTQPPAGVMGVRAPTGDDIADVDCLLGGQDLLCRVGLMEIAAALPAHDGLRTHADEGRHLFPCEARHHATLPQPHARPFCIGRLSSGMMPTVNSTMSAPLSIDQEPTMRAGRRVHDLPLAEAARRPGVADHAGRQRLKRGTLPAAQGDGGWRVAMMASIPVICCRPR